MREFSINDDCLSVINLNYYCKISLRHIIICYLGVGATIIELGQ